MLQRIVVLLLCLASVSAVAAPKPSVAPETIPHSVAMFMASMAGDGKTKVTFTATARGTHFFFEESGGVTVYSFEGDGYRKSEFLKGYTLAKALKKFDSGHEAAAPAAK